MAQLQSTNVQGSLCVNGVAVGGGKDFKYCCFTASTTFTPSQDLVDGDGHLEALVVAGGGGGGYAALKYVMQNPCNLSDEIHAAGGGGGSVAKELVKISATDACTVTVGAGGNGGYNNSWSFPGTAGAVNGGNSSFAGVTIGGGGRGSSMCKLCCDIIVPNSDTRGFDVYYACDLNGGCGCCSPGGAANFRDQIVTNTFCGVHSIGGQANCTIYACGQNKIDLGAQKSGIDNYNYATCESASAAAGSPVCYRTWPELGVHELGQSSSYFACTDTICQNNAFGAAFGGYRYDGKNYGAASYGDPHSYGWLANITPSTTGSLECDDECDIFSDLYPFASASNYIKLYQNNFPSECRLCLFCNDSSHSQAFPEEKGRGGLGGHIFYCSRYGAPSRGQWDSCMVKAGTKGSDGIVILKWHE
jgi:hypothetical protein